MGSHGSHVPSDRLSCASLDPFKRERRREQTAVRRVGLHGTRDECNLQQVGLLRDLVRVQLTQLLGEVRRDRAPQAVRNLHLPSYACGSDPVIYVMQYLDPLEDLGCEPRCHW